MPALRLLPLVVITSLGGFVLGCSLFGGEGAGGSSSGPIGNGGADGAGGTAGAVPTSSSSSSSGVVPDCEDHTTLDESNCHLLKQDCPDVGDVCIPSGTGTACVYGSGLKGPGAGCADNKECSGGLQCVFFICSPICCPSQEQAFCGNAKCNVSADINGKTLQSCNFAKTCALFANDCPENQQCRLSDPVQELSLCAPPSDMLVPEGGKCAFLNDCGANQRCSGTQTCRYLCALDGWMMKAPGEGGCPAGQTCNMVSTNYGECTPKP